MALSPFPTSAYAPLAVNPTLDSQVKTIGAKSQFSSLGISLVDLTGIPPAPVYGGVRDDDVFFAASLAKIAAMFAAYQLLYAVRRDASTVGSTSPAAILSTLESAYSATVTAGVPSGARPDAPLLSNLFTVTPSTTGSFVVDFDASGASINDLHNNHENFTWINRQKCSEWLKLAIRWSSDCGSSILISTLGMAYINGALSAAGFFNNVTNRGLWLAGSYVGVCPAAQSVLGSRAATWKPVPAAVVRNAHSANSRFEVATSRSVALLFSHLAQGRLIDPTTSMYSTEMQLCSTSRCLLAQEVSLKKSWSNIFPEFRSGRSSDWTIPPTVTLLSLRGHDKLLKSRSPMFRSLWATHLLPRCIALLMSWTHLSTHRTPRGSLAEGANKVTLNTCAHINKWI